MASLLEILKQQEGYAKLAKDKKVGQSDYGTYYDPKGNLTAGYGHLLSPQEYNKNKQYWDNLSEQEAHKLLEQDVAKHKAELDQLLKEKQVDPNSLSEKQQEALLNMTFNMGKTKLGGFNKMFGALRDGDYQQAANEVLNSKYAKDVGKRSEFVANQLSGGFGQPMKSGLLEMPKSKEDYRDKPDPFGTISGASRKAGKAIRGVTNFLGLTDEEEPAKPVKDAELFGGAIPGAPLGQPQEMPAEDTSTVDIGPKESEEAEVQQEAAKVDGKQADLGVAPKDDTTSGGEGQPVTSEFLREQILNLQERYSNNQGEFAEDSRKVNEQLAQELAAAQATYQQSKESTASKELWSAIIRGLGHIAAGIIGQQTGLNLGGLKFDKKDWQAEKDRALRELQNARQTAFSTMTASQRQMAEERAAAAQDYRVRSDVLKAALGSVEREEVQRQKAKESQDRLRASIQRAAQIADQKKIKDWNDELDAKEKELRRLSLKFSKAKGDEKDTLLAAIRQQLNLINGYTQEIAGQDLYPDADKLTSDRPGFLNMYNRQIDPSELVTALAQARMPLKVGNAPSEDPKIRNFADQNKISYQDAERIIRDRLNRKGQ